MEALRPGAVFAGRYVIERLLSRGGMGAVYAVRHARTGAELALKIMRPEIAADAGMRERFTLEATVSSRIQSAHVVTVVDADVDGATGIPFLVMELLRGSDLGALLRTRALTAPEVAQYITQAARALDRAHALGIIHRDLKPENLFLARVDDEPTRIKIIDFGIAKIIANATELGQSQHLGTPLYMAPEQMQRGRDIGPWTDVWSLGLTAYTLLVGRPYWEADTVHQVYAEILRGDRVPPSVRAGVALPAGFDAWFARCTDDDPTRRFASAGEAASALSAILGGAVTPAPPLVRASAVAATLPMHTEPMPSASTEVAVEAPRAPRSSLAPLVIGAALLALAAVVAVLLRRDEPAATRVEPAASPPAPPDHNPFIQLGKVAMQRHEVTRREYALFLAGLDPSKRAALRPLRDWDDGRTAPDRPVVWVTHRRASAFCRALSARLPRAADYTLALAGRRYPWGSQLPPPGDVAFDRPSATALPNVESSPVDRTPSGISDLFGSVREWTADADGGFAEIRGVALGTPAADAAAMFAAPSLKEIEEGDDPLANAEELAGPQLGFRCVR